MTPTQWYKKPEMIIALSALLTSVITTFVSIYSASIDRAYSRASMWPRLEIVRNFGGNNFSYGVMNNGNGPAIIKYANVTHDKTAIKRWSDIPTMPAHTQSHLSTRILPAQETIFPVRINGEGAKKFERINRKIAISVCYCSIFNECWLTNKNNEPQPIGQCEVNSENNFIQ